MIHVSTIQLGATVSSAGPSSTVTQTRIYVTLPSAEPVIVILWVPKMVVAAIPMMILDWGWLQANVAARRTWWALVASSVAMASLGSAPMTLEVASNVNVIQGAQCLGIPPVTPTVEPVSANG